MYAFLTDAEGRKSLSPATVVILTVKKTANCTVSVAILFIYDTQYFKCILKPPILGYQGVPS